MKGRPRGIERRAARARIPDGRQQGEPIHGARRPAEFAKSNRGHGVLAKGPGPLRGKLECRFLTT